MKSKLFYLLLFFITLFVIVAQKSQTVHGFLLDTVNPIKQTYRNLTDNVVDRSKSYVFQKETIGKLTKENKALKKLLLDQTRYLQQMSGLFKKIPSLEKLPYKSVDLVDTVSYVKLNSLNKILLSYPKDTNLTGKKVYGLIQENVVGGTAIEENGNLYGYLGSNPKCKFAVFIGKDQTPGIIEGISKSSMIIKYIPKWANIKIGDKVETSGLDEIFFKNIPVGTITDIKVENSYKTALVRSFADNIHPNFYFLITDARPRLATKYKQDTSFPERDSYMYSSDTNQSEEDISSIPKATQTKTSTLDISDYEAATETVSKIKEELPQESTIEKPVVKKVPAKTKRNKKKRKVKNKKKTKKKGKIVPIQEPNTTPISDPAPAQQPDNIMDQIPEPKRPNPLDYFKI